MSGRLSQLLCPIAYGLRGAPASGALAFEDIALGPFLGLQICMAMAGYSARRLRREP